jgi:hypothetical protein
VRAPVVLLGVSRSGTTLLRVLLGKSPDLAAPPETPWITGAYGRASLRDLCAALIDDPTGPVANLDGLGEADVLAATRAFVDTLLGPWVARRGKARLVLKTPKDLPHAGFLARVFPDACFVHVRRDGRDVAASTVRRKDMVGLGDFGAVTLEHALARWVAWEDLLAGFVRDGVVRPVATVRYEDLVSAPEPTLRALCAAVDARFDPAMLAWDLAGVELPPWEAGSTDVREHTAVDAASVGRFSRDVPEATQRALLQRFGLDLARLGYP